MQDAIQSNLLPAVAVALVSFFAGKSLIYVFNRIPATWLCDYGEEPSEELADKGIARIKHYPWKYVLTCLFLVSGLYLILIEKHSLPYAVTALATIWLLLAIAISDAKYMIVPDQFVVFLLLMAGAYIPFGANIKDMILGGLLGSGIMLLTALVGYLTSKKESLGFGDVKLMGAIGMIFGIKGCAVILAVASITNGIWLTYMILRHKINIGEMKPLGPFMAGSAIAYLVFV